MNDYNPEKILQRLEGELPQTLKHIPQLPFCKFLLMSAMQKSIRRGEVERAESFALSLFHADPRSLFRRISIISLEDIGMGGTDAVIDTIAAVKSPIWRRACGQDRVAVLLAGKLARSAKSRFVTELYSSSSKGNEAASMRKKVAKSHNSELETILLDPDQSPYNRTLAAWSLAGTDMYPCKNFTRAGNVQIAIDALRKLTVPASLTETCIRFLKDFRYPLALFLPLAADIFTRHKAELEVRSEVCLSSPEAHGLPTYALDMYSRIGQACIRQLKADVKSLKPYSIDQIFEGLFFLESENCNKRLTCDALERFRLNGIRDVMADLGLEAEDFMHLQRVLAKNLDIYNDIRLKHVEQAFSAAQNNLFSGGRA